MRSLPAIARIVPPAILVTARRTGHGDATMATCEDEGYIADLRYRRAYGLAWDEAERLRNGGLGPSYPRGRGAVGQLGSPARSRSYLASYWMTRWCWKRSTTRSSGEGRSGRLEYPPED